jgi:hypothetical protein
MLLVCGVLRWKVKLIKWVFAKRHDFKCIHPTNPIFFHRTDPFIFGAKKMRLLLMELAAFFPS